MNCLRFDRAEIIDDPAPYPHGRYAVIEMIACAKAGAVELNSLPKDVKRALAVSLVASKRK